MPVFVLKCQETSDLAQKLPFCAFAAKKMYPTCYRGLKVHTQLVFTHARKVTKKTRKSR